MNQGDDRMKRTKGLILALTTLVVTACASGGGAETGEPGTQRPRDNTHTTAAGVHLLQAGLAEGADARAHYEAALVDARAGIDEQPMNPKGYLLAGQASVGLHEWIQADSLFDRATDLYPPYEEQIASEREQGWVEAFNMGAEAMSAGDLETARAFFEGADLLYQERPEARMALGSVYMRTGDTERAAEAYRGALEILSGPPPEGLVDEQLEAWRESRQVAAFNAAQLLADTGNYEEAATVLRDFLANNEGSLAPETVLRAETALAGFLAEAGQAEDAEALFDEILNRGDLSSAEYFQIGIGFFNTGDYGRAAEAFQMSAEENPYSRDAVLNLVQSLYSQALDLEKTEETPERNEELRQIYDRILENADRVREFDPLNRNVLSFMLRAYRAKADVSQGEAAELQRQTQELYRIYQDQPYEVSNIGLAMQGDNAARLTGTLSNLAAEAGSTVRLRFQALDPQGQPLDEEVVTVTAPDVQSATEFSTTLDLSGGDFAGWRYEVVQ